MTDWLPELADDDLDVLIEALKAWESKDVASDMAGDLMGALMTKNDPHARAAYERERERENRERQAERRLREERSVMLRAKLLTIRDRRRAERMTQDALRQ